MERKQSEKAIDGEKKDRGTRERERGREKRKSHVRGSRARACPDMYTHREARTAAYPLWLRSRRYASSPPCARYATQPSPSLHAALSLSLSLSPARAVPHPRPAGYPPLVSASSVLSRPTATGPEGSGQFMPNYTLITVMARLHGYRWCTLDLSNCHGPREPRFFDRLLQQPRRCFLRELAAELSVSFSSRSTSPWLWPRLVITHAIHKGQQVGEGGESRWSISRKESSMR